MGYVDLEVVGVQIGVGHLKIRREVLLVLVLVRLWKDGGGRRRDEISET